MAEEDREVNPDTEREVVMAKWEYLILSLSSTNFGELEKHVNNLGAEGWEIITVMASAVYHTVYFKRPR